MKENKGLSDKELVNKYEAGTIDLSKVIKQSIAKHDFNKKDVFAKKPKDK